MSKRRGFSTEDAKMRLIEAELYDYNLTVYKINTLKQDIIHSSPELREKVKVSSKSDPTASAVVKIVSSRTIDYMEQIVSAIDKIYKELDEDKQKMIKWRYWEHPALEWDDIANRLYVTDRLLYVWRSEIIHRIGVYLRWL